MTADEELPRDAGENHLLKILGVTFGIAVTIGGMIGLGILRTPGTVAAQLGNVWLVLGVWALGGVYALFGTFQAIELGTSVPKAGGWYDYARRAFGNYAGFLIGWMDWINYPAGLALGAVISAEYLAKIFPAVPVKTTAAGILIALMLLNWRGVKAGSRVQEITSFGKAVIFLLLTAACFWVGGYAVGDQGATAWVPSGTTVLAGVVISLQAVIYTYDGWYAAIYFSEENTDPGRSLPRGMIGGVLGVAAIYLLVNAALFYVLPIEQVAGSELPVADAADAVFGENGKFVITFLAVISVVSLLNSNIMSGPRIAFAMARDGLFFRRAADVNKGGTPWFALLLTVGLAMPFIYFGTFETLLAILSFLFILIYLSGFAALIVLRRREPDLERPYRAWGYPWTTTVVIVGALAFLAAAIVADSLNALYTIALILISYPAYLYVKRLSRGDDKIAVTQNALKP
jgi:APA family basic amino acid/polyamine antiporter